MGPTISRTLNGLKCLSLAGMPRFLKEAIALTDFRSTLEEVSKIEKTGFKRKIWPYFS